MSIIDLDQQGQQISYFLTITGGNADNREVFSLDVIKVIILNSWLLLNHFGRI
jgi:hypothetical protein